jgi:DNA-binding transcriptional LysR family regulator
LEAAIGLAYAGKWMVADDIASSRPIEVLSKWTRSYPGYCLYYPGRRHMAASLRTFVDLAQEVVFSESREGVLMDAGAVLRVRPVTFAKFETH